MRVVSLVPSLTEAVALTAPAFLVGATDYCTHPSSLDVARVGGSKYPSLEAILALRPDLVLMNEEENRLEDASALRAAGVAVHVTFPRTVPSALAELARMFEVLECPRPAWLALAEAAWASPDGSASSGGPVRAVVPVWRRPWVVLGSDTFAGDMLRRLGFDNVYETSPERYPRPSIEAILETRPDAVILPDEPYLFTDTDGPESFPHIRYALISGRHLTWYGPSLVQARDILREQLQVVSTRD